MARITEKVKICPGFILSIPFILSKNKLEIVLAYFDCLVNTLPIEYKTNIITINERRKS